MEGRAQRSNRAWNEGTAQEDAIKQTATKARADAEPVSVKIHKENGRIQEERTYPRSADPRGSKG